MKILLTVLLAVSFGLFFDIGDVSADCSDTDLYCHAFCNSGPKVKKTSIGRCASGFQCDVEACHDHIGRAKNNCDAVFNNDPDHPCVVITGIYYATWVDFQNW